MPSFGVKVEKMRRTSNLMMAAVLHFQFEHLFNFSVKHHLKTTQTQQFNSKKFCFVCFCHKAGCDDTSEFIFILYGNTNIVQYYHEN